MTSDEDNAVDGLFQQPRIRVYSAMEGSLSLTIEGRVIRFSSALKVILGYEPEEVSGKDFTILCPAGKVRDLRGLLKAAREKAPVTGERIRLVRKDGGTGGGGVSG